MIRLRKPYLLFFGLLLLIEVFIAVFVHDRIVRPYVGDFLVVILLYCLLRGTLALSAPAAALLVFLFAVLVEAAQGFHLVHRLGWERFAAAKIFLGTVFEWSDIGVYAAGILLVLGVESKRKKLSRPE